MRFFPRNLFKRKRIYADWAATTPLHPRVARAMARARKLWANPSAIHAEGVLARRALEDARTRVARLVGTKPEEVYFLSGGTEANATIIQGVTRTKLEKGVPPAQVHVVTTAIEHSSVIETIRLFAAHGVSVTFVRPGPDGVVRAEDVLAAVTPATVLVSVMLANNEIGTVQPVSKIGAGLRKLGLERPVFHVDASQAPLWLSVDIEGLRADAMTLDAHKMQGPKGVGALVVRRRISWEPLMVGGGQERGKRPTTESIELAAGFAAALEIAQGGRDDRSRLAAGVQNYFFDRIESELPDAVINGSRDKRLPNNINISLPGISDPELAVLFLDKKGIACSTKSSCLKGEEQSYVVAALGGESWRARNTLRLSLAPTATRSDVDTIVGALIKLAASQKLPSSENLP
ncbi:MAG TPA: cysteine desulfurase family protein [Candidatus Paceibacterota bacterium]|nr:cysteine desulfurase family protein [Candidatus Paceibacterota bacterium]